MPCRTPCSPLRGIHDCRRRWLVLAAGRVVGFPVDEGSGGADDDADAGEMEAGFQEAHGFVVFACLWKGWKRVQLLLWGEWLVGEKTVELRLTIAIADLR